jgi:hypothetical protein
MPQGQISVAALARMAAPVGGLGGALIASAAVRAPWWGIALYVALGIGLGTGVGGLANRLGDRLIDICRPGSRKSVPVRILAEAIYMALPFFAIFAAASASIALTFFGSHVFHR